MDEPKQGAGGTPEPGASAPQTPPNPEGDAGKQTAKPLTVDELQAELERTRAALKTANSESAARRKKLDELDAKEKKAQQAQLSEVEQIKAQLAEAQAAQKQAAQEIAAMRLRGAVEREAVKLGFKNPDDAYLLADMTGVEMDDAGKVSGVESALKELVKARPYLVGADEKKLPPNINARDAGKGNQQSDEARKKDLMQRFRIKG